MLHISRLSEHGLIKPDDLPLLIIGLLQSRFHRLKQWNVPTIFGLDRHLGNIDRFLFDQVLLVYKSQAPRLNELVRELPMEEEAALLDAPRDPRF